MWNRETNNLGYERGCTRNFWFGNKVIFLYYFSSHSESVYALVWLQDTTRNALFTNKISNEKYTKIRWKVFYRWNKSAGKTCVRKIHHRCIQHRVKVPIPDKKLNIDDHAARWHPLKTTQKYRSEKYKISQ